MARSLAVFLAVAVVSVASGCSDSNGPGDPSLWDAEIPTVPPDATLAPAFLPCTVRPEQVDTFTVDSHGGSFRVDYARVTIPAGAMAAGVSRTFQMRTPSASIRSVVFSPIDKRGAMTFGVPVKLELDYKSCGGAHGGKRGIVYTTDADGAAGVPQVIAKVPSADDSLIASVSGGTTHFSRYAISY